MPSQRSVSLGDVFGNFVASLAIENSKIRMVLFPLVFSTLFFLKKFCGSHSFSLKLKNLGADGDARKKYASKLIRIL